MRRVAIITICLSLGWVGLHAAPKESTTSPDAGGVVIEPSTGDIASSSELTITFPNAMVSTDKIDMSGQPAPFVSNPKIEGDFLWKSQTEGVFTVKGVVAGAKHRLALVRDLKDATGKGVQAAGWSAEFSTREFNVTTESTEREHLEAQPQISLDSTYDVRLGEVAEHVYFQDRDSRQRLPVDVILWSQEKLPSQIEASSFSVSPRAPLPAGRTFDLVVNGLLDAKSRKPLPYLKVFPAGTTAPLEIEWVGAFNSAYEEPSIRIKFNDEIDPSEATPAKIDVQPPVKDAKLLASRDEVEVTGSFDFSQRYRVTISTALKGGRGYSLAKESRWGATFHPKEPCILFPASQIFLRARQELRFSFFQINTPAVTWKLARIPLEKLPVVTARISEFNKDARDPVTTQPIIDSHTGFNKQFQTELLTEAFNLPVIASGTTEAASGDASVKRDIRCAAPKNESLSGAYLLEASTVLSDGRIVGNRSIICTSDFVLTQKRTPASVIVRLTKMGDAQSVAGVTVRALTSESIELARTVTDKNGMATFDRAKLFPEKAAHLFIADTANGPALQFADSGSYSSGYWENSRQETKAHAEIITDRNLYRPGQVVKMKGLVREIGQTGLAIPSAQEVRWRVTESYGDRVAGEGTAPLSRDGGWEAEWTVPEKSKLGSFQIRCQIDKQDYEGTAQISIEEYRVPLFSAVVEAEPEVGSMAHAKVSSAYFHGAPNAGARVHWKASWTVSYDFGNEGDNYKRRSNSFADVGPRLDPSSEMAKTIEGDAQLDEHGFAAITCEAPFKSDAAVSKSDVFWRADVTSVDGQTITGGDTAGLYANPAMLGVRTTERTGEDGGIEAVVDAIDNQNAQVKDVPVHLDLFHIVTKVAKEQIAPFVFRYRNVDEFTKVASQESKTPAEVFFPVRETGRYVVAVGATDRKAALVSDETTLTGETPAELPVQNETSFKIENTGDKPFLPGDKAVFSIQAPFGGVAWVSVETDEILDTLLVPVAGNAGRIELPIKKEYAPNAAVSIYLVKPGGEKDLPRERFAYTTIEVRRPDRELKVEPQLAVKSVKPGETVRGEVRVTSENKPVEDVDLAVFAVDDAVLKLGSWRLPEVLAGFYRRNPFGVRSYQSLERYVEEMKVSSLTQKGFVIGDGGEEAVPNVTNLRKEFKTLAFWKGSLKTGRDGKAEFDFVAPDNLTTYRIVAVGQTKASQFGGDANATVQVSKPLLLNPALPRFLRHGDEVELRASVQQNFAESEEVTVRCVTDGKCKLVAANSTTHTAKKDAPTVFRFKAKVDDADLAPVKIRFEAVAKSNAEVSDAVELTLPVQAPTIVRRESVAGSFTGPQLDAQSKMPNDWKRGHGKFDVAVSGSPWLPKIAGIPLILEYPHGCFDQISTKLLGYSLLANLLAYLPDVTARDAEFRGVLERGMRQFNDSILESGFLPYWPGGTSPNHFVTGEAFWAVNESVNAGFQAPDGLRDKLAGGLKKIVKGETSADTFDRCFALFVLTQYQTDGDFATVAQDLYLRRNTMSDEGRALLAISLQRLNIMPREKEQLMKEIDAPLKERAFEPKTLSSMTRAEAICALAFDTVAPAIYTPEKKKRVRDRMLTLMDSSVSLSTQENLWILLAFKSMVVAEKPETPGNPQPPGITSKNQLSQAWLDREMGDPLLINGLNKTALTFLMKAEFSTDEVETGRVDRGFRVERVVKNMTDAKRTGEMNAPFKLGDQILITYRMNTRKKQSYVALEDSLPGGLEVVNPNLAMIGKFFELPANEREDHVLYLSYSEMRDRATLLYFDDFSPGNGIYSVLARATAAGTFRWPATQVVPMYDSRFSGLSPSSLCVVSGD